jgi:hypothetical protein
MSSTIHSRRNKAQSLAQGFAERDLRRRLQWGPGPVELKPPGAGGKSLVYLLRAPAGDRAVLYLFPKWRPWRDTVEALRFGAKHSLPIPRLLDAGSPWLDYPRHRHFFLTTDFAEGRHLTGLDWSNDTIDVLASTLARLHAVESPRPGKIRRPASGSLRDDWRRSVRSRIDQARRAAAGFDPASLDPIDAWFTRTIDALPEPSRFQLCHHHLFADDIILDPSGDKMTVIDCANLQFSRASRDLACVRRGLFPDRPDLASEFLERYFRRFPPASRADWEPEIPLFEAFYVLGKLRHAAKRTALGVEYLHQLRLICGLA